MEIKIQGLDKLMTKIQKTGLNADSELKKTLMESGKLVQGTAKELCAVDTGELRNSIVVEEHKENSVSIGTNIEHGAYVEYGTGQRGDQSVDHRLDWAGMEAQPFLHPALKQNEKNIKNLVENGLKKLLRRKY